MKLSIFHEKLTNIREHTAGSATKHWAINRVIAELTMLVEDVGFDYPETVGRLREAKRILENSKKFREVIEADQILCEILNEQEPILQRY